MADCNLNNNGGRDCKEYQGVPSGALIKSVPFSYTPSEMDDASFIESEIIATTDRLYILKDPDNYELLQQREAQNGQAASGRQLYYGQIPYAFAMHERKPRSYDIRNALLSGAGSQKVYAMIFTNKGFINSNLIDGNHVAREYDLTKVLMEAADYTTGEKMLRYIFTEYNPESNTRYEESLKVTNYDPNLLDGVNDVEITMISASATTLVCTVNLAGESSNNTSTLVTANFQKLDGSGVVEAVTAVYSSTTGQYTLTGTGLTDGTLNVLPQAGDAVYYEGTVAVDVTP